jgi:hypothetical protein
MFDKKNPPKPPLPKQSHAAKLVVSGIILAGLAYFYDSQEQKQDGNNEKQS